MRDGSRVRNLTPIVIDGAAMGVDVCVNAVSVCWGRIVNCHSAWTRSLGRGGDKVHKVI